MAEERKAVMARFDELCTAAVKELDTAAGAEGTIAGMSAAYEAFAAYPTTVLEVRQQHIKERRAFLL